MKKSKHLNTKSKSKFGGVQLRGIKVIVYILGIFILSEIVLRIFYNPPEFNPQFNQNMLQWMTKYVHLNSAGYRDKKYSFVPRNDTYRVYVLGNSYTYGWGINSVQDTYPKIIETNLKKKTKRKVEVINAGQPGFHLSEDVRRFEAEGKQFHPNLVLVGLHFDDANVNFHHIPRADYFLPKFITSIRLYHLFIGQFFEEEENKKNNEYYLNTYENPDSPDWQATEKLLLELKNEAGKINAKVAILIFPHINLKQPNSPYTFMALHRRYEEFAKKNNILVVDTYPLFEKYPHKEDLVLNPNDEHPSVAMNQLTAQAFMQQIDTTRLLAASQAIPSTKIITLDKNNAEIGDYSLINSIKSSSSLPWLYFDSLSSDIQSYPLYHTSSRQTYIYPDRINVPKNQPTEILYHLYPDASGRLIIPDKVYGYQVIGINALKGISLSSQMSSPIIPSSVKRQGGSFIITYNPHADVYVAQAELFIAVNKLVVNPVDNHVASATTAQTIKEKVSEDKNFLLVKSKDKIVAILPTDDKRSILKKVFNKILVIFGITDQSSNLKYSNVFVNGVITQVRVDQVDPYQIKLNFDRELKRDQIVEFSFITEYPMQNDQIQVKKEMY